MFTYLTEDFVATAGVTWLIWFELKTCIDAVFNEIKLSLFNGEKGTNKKFLMNTVDISLMWI